MTVIDGAWRMLAAQNLQETMPMPLPGRYVLRAAARVVAGVAAAGGLAASAALPPASAAPAAVAAGAAKAPPGVRPVPAGGSPALLSRQYPEPLTTSQCRAKLDMNCYTPLQYRVAYDLNPLYSGAVTGRPVTGAGKTIVIVDSFGSPTIRGDINAFDSQFGLPPLDLKIIKWGNVPAFDPGNSTDVGWAEETSLDVEYAHAIAPGARIVLVETAVAETEGTTGFPQMMSAEKWLVDNGVGDVISQSFGATENTFPGFSSGDYSSLLQLRYAFKDAAAHGVTVLAASGDNGATDDELNGTTLYSYKVDSWPSSDPLVTSVGGTQLTLDNAGSRLAPDSVWNDGSGASGGGRSGVFARPVYQDPVASVTGTARGTPDISMTAAVNGGGWIYMSFAGIEKPGATMPGWYVYGGTSEATPIFAGVVALADQVAGRRLGVINPALYTLGELSARGTSWAGIVDVTKGNNSYGGVTGYAATPGYDLASGWGTVDAAKFVPALARLASTYSGH